MHYDDNDETIHIHEKIHINSQASTVLLASLCKDGYNKVSGFDNAKEIWDILKIAHEGNDITIVAPGFEGKPNANHVRARIRNSRT
jgi:hypothetical protein